MPGYVWIPIIVLGTVLVLLLLMLLLSRIQGGRFLRPIALALAKIPFMRRWMQRASIAAYERSNPELAGALRKINAFGEISTPEQMQRAMRVLTPAERRAYMDAAGAQAEQAVEEPNRQLRRRMERGVGGMPAAEKPVSTRPGAAGRKSGRSSSKKKR
jgi:hypothetical protein